MHLQSLFNSNLTDCFICILCILQGEEYNHPAGKLRLSMARSNVAREELITLIPYGCTTLRISEFPFTD